MSACEELLEGAQAHDHIVQLYESDDAVLVRNVARYLGEGLTRGDCILVVATAEHRARFQSELEGSGADVQRAIDEERFVMLDARATLARFMVDGYPDAGRFQASVGAAVRAARARALGADVRVFGEMVGILWKEKQFPAAIRLEQLWNRLHESIDFSLFCAYQIDVFDKQFDVGIVEALLCAHTHLLPSGKNGDLDSAVNRAMHDVLGPKVIELRPLSKGNRRTAWSHLPRAEGLILWLRSNLPERADDILARARRYYRTAP